MQVYESYLTNLTASSSLAVYRTLPWALFSPVICWYTAVSRIYGSKTNLGGGMGDGLHAWADYYHIVHPTHPSNYRLLGMGKNGIYYPSSSKDFGLQPANNATSPL